MQKILYAIPELCTGCNRCVYACAAIKEDIFQPSRSRIRVNSFPPKGYSVPSICFQCPKPECMESCPEEAISMDENGIVTINDDTCTGCGVCVEACPYGMIGQDENGIAYKCDYCGGDPACVKECYPGAIVYLDRKSENGRQKQRLLQMKYRIESGSPEEKRYQIALKFLEKARQ